MATHDCHMDDYMCSHALCLVNDMKPAYTSCVPICFIVLNYENID